MTNPSPPDAATSLAERAAFYLAFGSAASILFSIAVSNILLTLALVVLLLSGVKLRMPPIWIPLVVFMAGTLVSLALSDQPSAGRPQIRKFFVYLTLLVVFSTFRNMRQVRWLFLAVVALAALSAVRGLSQYAWMLRACGDQYGCYVGERITGFMSHWMTFGGHMMIALVLGGAFALWGTGTKRLWLLAAAMGVIAAALFAGGTRSIWLATVGAAAYLLWSWKRWTVVLLPVVLLIAVVAAPGYLRQRVASMWQPHGEVDSNEHRRITWRTGLRMIEAHPVFGLGPEHVKLQFQQYLPPDVKRLPDGWYGHLHNIYLHYAAERGIPTLLALLWMIGLMLRDFQRSLRKATGDARFILHAAIGAIIAVLIGGIFEHNLGDTEVLVLFLAIASCGYVTVEAVSREHA